MHGHNRLRSTIANILPVGSDKNHLLNKPATASLIYTATNVFARAAALVFTPFFTRILSRTEYGNYALFHTYVALISAIGTLEIGGGILLRVLGKHRSSPRAALRCAAVLSLFSVSLTFLAFLAYRRMSGGGAIFRGDALLIFASVAFPSMINLFTAYCRFFYRWRASVVITAVLSVLSPLASLFILLSPYRAGSNAAAVKIAVGTIVLAIVGTPIIIYMLKGKNDEPKLPLKVGISELLRLAIPMLPYYLSVMIINESDKLIIERYLGGEELAKYSVAYSAGVAASVISTGASQILCAWAARKCAEGKFNKINEVILGGVKILSALIIAFLCAAPELFSLLAPPEYSTALFSVYPVAIAIIPIFLISLITTISLGSNRTLPSLISGVSAAVLHGQLAHYLIPRYGIGAAGIVHLISYVILLLILALSYRFIDKEKLINVNQTFQIIILSSMLSFVTYQLKSLLLMRILIAIAAVSYAAIRLYKERYLICER